MIWDELVIQRVLCWVVLCWVGFGYVLGLVMCWYVLGSVLVCVGFCTEFDSLRLGAYGLRFRS